MSQTRSHNSWRQCAIGGLALVALGISVYLTWMSAHDEALPGCGGGSSLDCDHVLTTRWSQWLGIPVSYLAILTYVVIALTSMTSFSSSQATRDWSRTVLCLTCLLAAGASLWFMFLQLMVIGKFCLYCSACHLCGISIAILALWPSREGRPSRVPVAYLATMATVGVSALIVGQIAFQPKTFAIGDATEFVSRDASHLVSPAAAGQSEGQYASNGDIESESVESVDGDDAPSVDDLLVVSSPESPSANHATSETSTISAGVRDTTPTIGPRTLTLADGRVTIEVGAHPLLGSPKAENIAVKLFDYTCPECRQMFDQFEQARVRYGDQLAIIVLPVPLDSRCNPHIKQTRPSHAADCQYARLALAVWNLDASKFEAYHRWLMSGRRTPPLADAVTRAERLFGREKLQTAVRSTDVADRIEQYVQLYSSTGKRLPFVLIKEKAIKGYLGRVTELFGFLERYLGFEPVAP